MNFLKGKSKFGLVLVALYLVVLLGFLGFIIFSWFQATRTPLTESEQKSILLLFFVSRVLLPYAIPFLFFLMFIVYYIGAGIEYVCFPGKRGEYIINKRWFIFFIIGFIVSILLPLPIFPHRNATTLQVASCALENQVDAMVIFREPVPAKQVGIWEKEYNITAISYKPQTKDVSGNINRQAGEPFEAFLKRLTDRQISFFEMKEDADGVNILKTVGPSIALFNGKATVADWKKLQENSEVQKIQGECLN